MQDADFLLTVAEVSVAFAGFASLIGMVGRGRSENLSLALGRLRGMLEAALLVLLFALLPLVVAKFGLSEQGAWRLAAGTFAVAGSARLAYAFPRTRIPGISRWRMSLIVGVQGTANLLLLVLALGGAGALGAAVYALALYLYLAVAAAMFLFFATDLFTARQETGETR